MSTYLFDRKAIRKFFDKLSKMDRHIGKYYSVKSDKSSSGYLTYCQKQIFIRRTINKWLKDTKLVLYKKDPQTGLHYKQYISIQGIEYVLGYSDELQVYIYDYSRPTNVWNSFKLSHNGCLNLEGEWSETDELHHQMLKLSTLILPKKEFKFKAYDPSKFKKRGKNRHGETEWITEATTYDEAYENRKNYEGDLIIGELLD